MIFGEDNFTFKQADFYPFKDAEEIKRVRAITKEEIMALNGKHPSNPNICLEVLPDDDVEMVMIADIVKRIVDSDRYDKKVVMIMPNPSPTYRKVAYLLHQLKVNCRNVKFYMMDEWADQDGNIAPLSYKAGFGNAFYHLWCLRFWIWALKRRTLSITAIKLHRIIPKCWSRTARQILYTVVRDGRDIWRLSTR